MIIDLHTRVWSNLDQLGREIAERLRSRPVERWGHLDASPPAHESAMSCVDAALVLGFCAERMGAGIPNEFIAEHVGKEPRRRLGIAGIDPMSDAALDQIDAAVGLGLVGVTVAPVCQGFHPAHSAAVRVYERCAELSLPLIVAQDTALTASAELEFGRPSAWDEVARTIPGLPIVLGQLGYPWIDETLVLLSKHEHLYADISSVASRPWQLYNALLSASGLGVMEKLLFGSGFPHETPARAIENMYTVNAYSHGTHLPSIPRSSIRSIVERDSLACLGIEADVATVIKVGPDAAEHSADAPLDDSSAPMPRESGERSVSGST